MPAAASGRCLSADTNPFIIEDTVPYVLIDVHAVPLRAQHRTDDVAEHHTDARHNAIGQSITVNATGQSITEAVACQRSQAVIRFRHDLMCGPCSGEDGTMAV